MAEISQLLYTDFIWFIAGLILFGAYFLFRKKFKHHALFSLSYENFLRTIIIPIASIFIVLSAFRFISGISLTQPAITSWFSIISYVVTGPFFEELFLRGLILGGSFYLASKLENKYASWFFMFLGFIIQLFLFVWMHGFTDTTKIVYLSVIGLSYSLLMIFNKKDILPSIVAHATTNLFIILGVFG